ncbi:MAG: S9 family peptidase [Pseudomonadales bacterium]
MADPIQAPYGSWKSPITTDLIVAETIGIGSPKIHGERLFWLESRPQEGGRNVIVMRSADGTEKDLTPTPFNVRTRVHEYGGAAFVIHDDFVCFSNFSDQQLYLQRFDGEPKQLTDQPTLRFADGVVDETRDRIICVIEDHSKAMNTEQDDDAPPIEPDNKIGAVSLADGTINILAEGHDFYSAPRISPDGQQLAFVTWDHPNMPWDSTCLWLARFTEDGLSEPQLIAGDKESIQQPRFSPNGTLYYISDCNGWWNLYRADAGCVHEAEAEFGEPHWVFGQSTWDFVDEHNVMCVYSVNNICRLAELDTRTGQLRDVDLPFTVMGSIHVFGHRLALTGASPTLFNRVAVYDLDLEHLEIIKQASTVDVGEGYLSVPEAIAYPTANEETAHAFYYPPKNQNYEAPAGDKPPLLVKIHGGPTGATHNDLNLPIQFWTSRGFAVLDVNYRGSTGYGRVYRNKLRQSWGIVDVADTVFGARYLVDQGLADPQKLAIRGGSAGGYTTLAALTFEHTFTAGASHYGVSDLEALARETHKFEARYLDSMIGQYPAQEGIYKARSPINHVEKLSCPVIFFQGLEDKIVPPNQAETMANALAKKGLPVAYVPFEGEQHGFRKAENIKRALDLELYFYGKVFGFEPADDIEPIEITNL